MCTTSTSPSPPWLTLQDASKKVGVTPATLRHWANQGRIRTFRTPGGHRRFSASEISAMIGSPPAFPTHSPQNEMLIHSAIGRARLDIGRGCLEKTSWYRHFDESGKEIHRKLGRQLMTLLLQVLPGQARASDLAHQAHKLGREYGRACVHEKIVLTDALRAFLFFRDYIFEDLVGHPLGGENPGAFESVERYRRLSHFINEILIAMVQVYSRPKKTT